MFLKWEEYELIMYHSYGLEDIARKAINTCNKISLDLYI